MAVVHCEHCSCDNNICVYYRREVDLLLGNWAEQNVPALSSDDLSDFEYLLELETTEIHDVILGSVAPPPVCIRCANER